MKLLVITGPTASGKSRLALDLAQVFPLEIISADSMQVYRYMDIGTDKPSLEEREKVPHHLIDIKYPDETFSVEEFQRRAASAISDIASRNMIPCVVGGTGFYIRALLKGYPLEKAPPNPELRRKLRDMAREKGNAFVHGLLAEIDPESFMTLHPNDLKRVIRAIEYYEATGMPISQRKNAQQPPDYDSLVVGLLWPRQELYQRIDNRVESQFQRGFVEEVRTLLDMGYSPELTSMQGLGYKEICFYLGGLLTLEETKNLIKRNTRRFAKRQFTWFRKEEGIIWINLKEEGHDGMCRIINEWLADTGDNWRDHE